MHSIFFSFIGSTPNIVASNGLDGNGNGNATMLPALSIRIIGGAVLTLLVIMLIKIVQLFKKTPALESFDQTLTRERLVQSARILLVDDETPLLISELKNEGFSVDHDKLGNDLHNIENQIYDLAILDFHGVGHRLGSGQGLDLMKHIRRVSPRTRLVAYTSRSLNAAESEFFRLSHAVLPKDMGLGDSLALIEGELRKTFSKEHLLEALIAKLEVSGPEEKRKLKEALTKALSRNDESSFKAVIKEMAGAAGEKAAELIISKIFLEK